MTCVTAHIHAQNINKYNKHIYNNDKSYFTLGGYICDKMMNISIAISQNAEQFPVLFSKFPCVPSLSAFFCIATYLYTCMCVYNFY